MFASSNVNMACLAWCALRLFFSSNSSRRPNCSMHQGGHHELICGLCAYAGVRFLTWGKPPQSDVRVTAATSVVPLNLKPSCSWSPS